MINWIHTLINNFQSEPVQAKPEGEVRIDGDKVIYVARTGYRKTIVDLTLLQYLYLYTTENCRNLVLNDYHQHFIPCSAIGFDLFFQQLTLRFQLDKKKFANALADKKPQKVELWRAESPDTCHIPDSPDRAAQLGKELSEGFWICANPRQWISWDMTSEALATLPSVYQTTNEYGLTEIRFHHPVQLGNLVLDDWRYYLPVHLRLDVPLDSFYVNLRIRGNGDQNYFLAKKALTEMMGARTDGYERVDQNVSNWLFGGLKFSLIYWYDSPSSYQSGYAYLGLRNERAYPGYEIDRIYEENGIMSEFVLINHPFRIGSDFRRSHYFRKTPQFVARKLAAENAKFTIWIDEKNKKAGFGNHENAMIFPLSELTGFQLQNVLPGRSGGGTSLSATLANGAHQCILVGECNALDQYAGEVAELFQLPVVELTPYEE